jgi:hypothetical protein
MAAFLFEILVDFFLGLVVDTFVALYRWLRPRRISAEGEQLMRRGPGASQTRRKPTTPPG